MVEQYLRGIAGFFILLSVLLALYHCSCWLLFTAFVGLNLLQSAFTNWCPMMAILRKLGLGPQTQNTALGDPVKSQGTPQEPAGDLK